MKYLLTIWGDETQMANATPDDIGAMMAAYETFGKAVAKAGVMLGGEGLEGTDAATTVRVRNGERAVTDGPFAETKEQLGGYYLLDCKDLDEAIEWAARIPGASSGSVEVRPVMNYEAFGHDRDAIEGSAVG